MLSGQEPRTVKRFVNIYRIVRARLTAAERSSFLGERGQLPDYPLVAILIAIETGQTSGNRRCLLRRPDQRRAG